MWQKAEGRRQKAEGFYVYYWYMVVWVVKSLLTFMTTAIKLLDLQSGTQKLPSRGNIHLIQLQFIPAE
jgi:hypothetical protein